MVERANTAQAIGALTAQVEAVISRLDRDREDRKVHDEQADKSRQELKAALSELQSNHKEVIRRINKIEPVTDMVTSWKAKVVGGVAVLGLIGGILIGGVTYFKDQIVGVFFS